MPECATTRPATPARPRRWAGPSRRRRPVRHPPVADWRSPAATSRVGVDRRRRDRRWGGDRRRRPAPRPAAGGRDPPTLPVDPDRPMTERARGRSGPRGSDGAARRRRRRRLWGAFLGWTVCAPTRRSGRPDTVRGQGLPVDQLVDGTAADGLATAPISSRRRARLRTHSFSPPACFRGDRRQLHSVTALAVSARDATELPTPPSPASRPRSVTACPPARNGRPPPGSAGAADDLRYRSASARPRSRPPTHRQAGRRQTEFAREIESCRPPRPLAA